MLDVIEGAAGEPRLALGRIRGDRNAADRETLSAGLDQGFEGIGVAGHDIETKGGLARKSAEAAGCVRDAGAGELANGPASHGLKQALLEAEVRERGRIAVTNHDIRVTTQDWLDQARDITAAVLVIPIGVHDDIRTEAESGIEASAERGGKAAVAGMASDIICTGLEGDLGGAVGRAITDDEDKHLVNARDGPRDISHDAANGRLLVIAGNLHDKPHDAPLAAAIVSRETCPPQRAGAVGP